MDIQWIIADFDQLSAQSVYDMLSLRAEVFVVEQEQPYQDVDYRDLRCRHVLGYDAATGILACHCRVFRCGGYFDDGCIGRVVVKPSYRGTGLGHLLVEKGIEVHNEMNGRDKSITISAQMRLHKFYEAHGFVKSSTTYQEDHITHFHMTRPAEQESRPAERE